MTGPWALRLGGGSSPAGPMESAPIVVCSKSQTVHVFRDRKPFNELLDDKITIAKLESSEDMTASTTHKSLYYNII